MNAPFTVIVLTYNEAVHLPRLLESLQGLSCPLYVLDSKQCRCRGGHRTVVPAEANLYVMPSQNENFANVVIKAMAVGRSVLLSDQVGLSDYVAEQNLGWVYSGGSAALAVQLQLAHAARTQRQAIRTSALARIRGDFKAEALARQYTAAYEHVVLNPQ